MLGGLRARGHLDGLQYEVQGVRLTPRGCVQAEKGAARAGDFGAAHRSRTARLWPEENIGGLHYKGDTFQLFGVVVHHGGSIDGGHYVAYVRSLRDGGNWHAMNDSSTRRSYSMKPDSGASVLLYRKL